MKRAVMVFLLVCAGFGSAQAQLKVDFGVTGSPVESGFQAYVATHEVGNTFTPQSFQAFGATITVALTWPSGAADTAKQMFDRTTDGRYAYTGEHGDLIRDWTGTDGRVASANPLVLKLSGLPRGNYSWLSYHHDGIDQTGVFSVTVKGASGTATTANLPVTNSAGGDNVTAFASVSTFATEFTSNGTDDVAFEFTITSDTANVATAFFVMNAFEIELLTALDLAHNPTPSYGQTDVLRDSVLSWSPGVYAASHDVYLGTSPEDVANATRADTLGVLAEQALDVNSFDPGRLDLGKTYYWRIDEVNAPPSTEIVKGEVWSFTVEPYSIAIAGVTAAADSTYNATSVAQKTVDGSGLSAADQHSVNAQDMWISGKTALPHWIQYTFDGVYKLDEMWVWNSNQTMESTVGMGAMDVAVQYSTDGAAWTDLGNFVSTQAPGDATCSADTKVLFGGVAAKYVKLTITSNWGGLVPQGSLSEVRFFAIPVAAREPSPTPGTASLRPQVSMSWRAGREAGSHEVYVGTDPNAVADGTVQPATTTQPEYEVPLDLESTYYWKVVEVNQVETPTAWPSDVWSFSTGTYISIDDFESYTNDSPKRVFQTWIDGSGFSPDEFFPNGGSGNGTGSLVGYDPTAGNVMETTNFYDGGRQSMPLYYDNSAAPRVSEAVCTLDPAKDTTDWTRHGLTTLVLWFRGDSANGPAPVYVKINGTKKLYNNGAAATTTPIWKPFQVDLASVPASDLKNVKTITIGVGDGSAGGTGTIFVDEIRLYATAPQVAVATDPGTKGLETLYSMEGDVKDSSGKSRNGTANGDPGYVDGRAGYGKALAFDGTNDYIDLPIGNLLSTLGGSTVAAWVDFSNTGGDWQRVFDFGTDTTIYMFLTPRQGTTGATRCAIRTAAIGEQGANGPVTLPSGWHHMAVVFDDAAMRIRLYVDGVEVGSGATALLPKDMGVTTQNWLGRSQWPDDGFFTGSIDDFRIYSRPLSEGEVLYLAGDR